MLLLSAVCDAPVSCATFTIRIIVPCDRCVVKSLFCCCSNLENDVNYVVFGCSFRLLDDTL